MSPLIFACFLILQTVVPNKAEEEFIVKFDLSFKKRHDVRSENVVWRHDGKTNTDPSPLPYLQVSMEVTTRLSDEVRLKLVRTDGSTIFKRKITPGMRFTVFSDFVDDVTARTSEYTYSVYFLGQKGEELRKVTIEFDEEGFYLVNGKKKGKL